MLLLLPVTHAGAQYARGPESLPPETIVVRQTQSGVLERSTDGGTSWTPVSGLPTRVLPAYRLGEPLPVTAYAAAAPDPADPVRRRTIASSPGVKLNGYAIVRETDVFLAALGNRLLVSRDGLASWSEVSLVDVTNQASYITALAIDPRDGDHWLLGTSYDGVYRSTDAGASWTDLTARRDLWPSYLGAGFFEEVSGIWFTAYDYLIVESGFGQGYLRLELDPLRVRRLGPLAEGETAYAAMERALSGWSGGVEHVPNAGSAVAGSARSGEAEGAASPALTSSAAAARREVAADRTGIYLAAHHATPEKLPAHLDYMDRHGFDSVVVDFKDDLGRLTYASQLERPRAAGAVNPVIDPRELVEAAHARGIYVIARVVVFKDPKLYAYDNYRYALWDGRLDRPWGVFRTYTNEETEERRTVQVEHWVDAYSPEVWEYNVDIAQEIAAMGVDEIQFDYIRFPSDGNTSDIVMRYAVDGADRVQALEGFLSAAREAIEIPIGIDVFGFNAWAHMNYLGQDVTRLADYVDVISPMFYPSHFARAFLPQFTYLDRAYVIYDLGTRRAHALANRGSVRSESGATGTLIRPYIQAFLIGAELEYELPTYTRYLQLQVDASLAASASGYTLWNASGRYYMLP